jgi:hypothetical protein
MAIIHTYAKKRKASKPNAKQRELAAEWEKLMKKYEPKKPLKASNKPTPISSTPYVRETEFIPSLNSSGGIAAKREAPVYTGTAIKGIGTMHKSNAVPIFSDEQAIEISRMRRG